MTGTGGLDALSINVHLSFVTVFVGSQPRALHKASAAPSVCSWGQKSWERAGR